LRFGRVDTIVIIATREALRTTGTINTEGTGCASRVIRLITGFASTLDALSGRRVQTVGVDQTIKAGVAVI